MISKNSICRQSTIAHSLSILRTSTFVGHQLAEVIKKAAHVQIDKGRTPEKDGSLHLFVITNVTEGGLGRYGEIPSVCWKAWGAPIRFQA